MWAKNVTTVLLSRALNLRSSRINRRLYLGPHITGRLKKFEWVPEHWCIEGRSRASRTNDSRFLKYLC